MTPEERLVTLGLTLPPVPVPVASYLPYRISHGLLFISGHVPRNPDNTLRTGLVGRDTTIDEAYMDARNVGLQLLAVAKNALGELGRITAVIKLFGTVNAHPSFGDHPRVVNGCSDLLTEILSDVGQHARSAIGVGSLPGGVTVEIEAIFEFE